MPKVGEKFYWLDNDNVIRESVCYEVVEKPGYATSYFNTPKGEQFRTFVTEYDILDPETKKV